MKHLFIVPVLGLALALSLVGCTSEEAPAVTTPPAVTPAVTPSVPPAGTSDGDAVRPQVSGEPGVVGRAMGDAARNVGDAARNVGDAARRAADGAGRAVGEIGRGMKNALG